MRHLAQRLAEDIGSGRNVRSSASRTRARTASTCCSTKIIEIRIISGGVLDQLAEAVRYRRHPGITESGGLALDIVRGMKQRFARSFVEAMRSQFGASAIQ